MWLAESARMSKPNLARAAFVSVALAGAGCASESNQPSEPPATVAEEAGIVVKDTGLADVVRETEGFGFDTGTPDTTPPVDTSVVDTSLPDTSEPDTTLPVDSTVVDTAGSGGAPGPPLPRAA